MRLSLLIIALVNVLTSNTFAQTYHADIQPLLRKYCVECHTGDDPAGEVNFAMLESMDAVDESFELWGKVVELLASHAMPPEDEPQPNERERRQIAAWYQSHFVDSVVAKPGRFQPRRLSVTEYRNTLRSLFGFDLEVAIREAEQTISEKSLVLKLLPTDPPGKSHFCNDTHSNPLTTAIWEQYSYLSDVALSELFSTQRRAELVQQAGMLAADEFQLEHAETLLRHFVPRAYRRSVPEHELAAHVVAVRSASDLVMTTKMEMKSVLMSPKFLYRGLLMPTEPGDQQQVDDFELAERLSYFLWGDMPDKELTRLATAGSLSVDSVLHAQVERMLDSPKSVNLATDFAEQWLSLNEIDHVSDNPPFAVAMKSQPLDFMHYLFAENRPLLELIDSDVAFVNTHTRRYYNERMEKYQRRKGIEIEIVPNVKVALQNSKGRGGLLTMPGILAMNRGPILRGVWMLERILGEELPDPPADVGQVQGNVPGENLSFRERFAQHREQASCALCHDKIDPLGFALGSYDEKGGYTRAENYKPARKKKGVVDDASAGAGSRTDTSGKLPTGEAFQDFEGLQQILLNEQREPVIRNIVNRLLAYALCRKLEIFDQPTVTSIVEAMQVASTDSEGVPVASGTYRDLVHAIVGSLPFRETFVPGIEP